MTFKRSKWHKAQIAEKECIKQQKGNQVPKRQKSEQRTSITKVSFQADESSQRALKQNRIQQTNENFHNRIGKYTNQTELHLGC